MEGNTKVPAQPDETKAPPQPDETKAATEAPAQPDETKAATEAPAQPDETKAAPQPESGATAEAPAQPDETKAPVRPETGAIAEAPSQPDETKAAAEDAPKPLSEADSAGSAASPSKGKSDSGTPATVETKETKLPKGCEATGNSHAIRKVVVSVDDSPPAERAFRWFLQHQYRIYDRIFFVHVFPSPILRSMTFATPIIIPQREWNHLVAEQEKANRKVEEKFIKISREHGITDSKFTLFESSITGITIVDFAHEMGADHIVLGTRGRGLIKRTLLGSTSNYVLHHTSLPVTIVPPEKD